MTRIAEALERVEAIQTDSAKNTQLYHQLRDDLSKAVKEALLERPAIKNELSAEKLAKALLPSLVGKLPDPAAIKAAGQELLTDMQAEREKFPTQVRMKGDFYGMASRKAFIAYMGFLLSVILVAVGTSLYYWHQAQEKTLSKIAEELNAQQAYYQGQITTYKKENPKYGEKYFPEYDKSKLEEIVNQLRQEKATSQE